MITYSAWRRWRSCTRKRQMTWLEANQRTLEAWRDGDGTLQPYRCEHCSCWHVGHEQEAA